MVLFGFEGDEIQIRLTSLPRNLMSGADSGNYLLCKLGCSLEPETSRASPSYVAAQLSLLLLSLTISSSAPKTTLLFAMFQMQNNPFSPHYPNWSSASCQTKGLVSLLWSFFTILMIIKRFHLSLQHFGWINWTNQPLFSVSWSLIQQSTNHKNKADKEWCTVKKCKAVAVKRYSLEDCGINCD